MDEFSNGMEKLAAALVKAQAQFPSVKKGSSNPAFKKDGHASKYASLLDVVEATKEVLTECGLAVTQFPDHEGLTTYLLHESGQYLAHTMSLVGVTTAQSQGSALTYARRYAYMAVLGLVADDDDDGNAATQGARTSRSEEPAVKVSAKHKELWDKLPAGDARKPFIVTATGKNLPTWGEYTEKDLTLVELALMGPEEKF